MPPANPNDHHVRLALLEDWRDRTDATLAELRDNIGKILDMQAETRGAQRSTDKTIKLGIAVLGMLITLLAAVLRSGH